MIDAAVDTNIIVAAVLTTNDKSASHTILNRHRNREFRLVVSPPILLEIRGVLRHPELRAVHRLTDEDIHRFCRRLEVGSRMVSGLTPVSPAMTRDVTDTKWIALVLEAKPQYLVTNDRRHLIRLEKVGETQIVTPRTFLRELDRLSALAD